LEILKASLRKWARHHENKILDNFLSIDLKCSPEFFFQQLGGVLADTNTPPDWIVEDSLVQTQLDTSDLLRYYEILFTEYHRRTHEENCQT